MTVPTDKPTSVVPISVTGFFSASEVLDWVREGIITRAEARLLVGLDDPRKMNQKGDNQT